VQAVRVDVKMNILISEVFQAIAVSSLFHDGQFLFVSNHMDHQIAFDDLSIFNLGWITVIGNGNVISADADIYGVILTDLLHLGLRQLIIVTENGDGSGFTDNNVLKEVHGRGTDEFRTETVDRIIVDICRGVIHLQDDESISGYAACLDLEQAPDYILDEACVRSKADPGLPYTMVLDHRGQVTKKSFTLEDLSPDRYALYHAFDIDDLSEDSNTLFRIVYSVLSLHLSGFAKILPGKKLSVWLRMKFSGKMYGGSKDKKDQISLDRMYLVVRD